MTNYTANRSQKSVSCFFIIQLKLKIMLNFVAENKNHAQNTK